MAPTLWKWVVRTGRPFYTEIFLAPMNERIWRSNLSLLPVLSQSHFQSPFRAKHLQRKAYWHLTSHTHTHQKIIFKLSFTYMIVMCNYNMLHRAWWITVKHFITFWGWNSASTIYHLVLSHVQWFLTHSVNRYSVTAEHIIHLCYKYNLQYCNVKILKLCYIQHFSCLC
jgi:hypothetical protein